MIAPAMVLAFAGLILAVRRRWMIVTVRGHSMEPTLHDGERLVARRWSRAAIPVIGDVIVFWPDALGYRIKRVAGVAGDRVPPWMPVQLGERIPAGHVIVRGDNPRSEGSRELGYIAIHSIIARHRPGGPIDDSSGHS
jgi:signal peptidase I